MMSASQPKKQAKAAQVDGLTVSVLSIGYVQYCASTFDLGGEEWQIPKPREL
jgi:hypothetical protein